MSTDPVGASESLLKDISMAFMPAFQLFKMINGTFSLLSMHVSTLARRLSTSYTRCSENLMAHIVPLSGWYLIIFNF